MEPTQPTARHDDDKTTTTMASHARVAAAGAAAAASLARSLARARARAVAVAMAVAMAAYDARAFDDARAMSLSRVGFLMTRERSARWPTPRVFTNEQKPPFYVFLSASVPWSHFKSIWFVLCVFLGRPGRVPVVISMRN